MADVMSSDLPFTVELWNQSGTRVDTVLACAGHHVVGRGAFHAAVRLHHDRIVTLRHGDRIVARHDRRIGFRLAAMHALYGRD